MPQDKTKFAIPRPGRPKAPADPPLPVENPDPDTGLTAAQAARRMEAGLDNREVASPTKTTWQIVRENTFTFFNLVFVVLAALLWSVGSFANMGFLIVAVCNTVIGIVQQLRSKHAVDKLTLVATDGKRLALISRELKLTPEEEGSIILPKNTVTELEKLLAQGKDVKISFNNRQVAFDIAVGEESQNNGLTGSIYLVSKILEGNYPNYKQVIPREAEHRIKVDRELMLAAVQRISLVASDKQKLVRLKMADNQMVVSCQTVDVGEGIEPVEVEYDGPEVQIGFNPDFLQSPLSKLTKDEIYFEFKDENTPGVFKTLDNFLCVIMPMRI